MNTQLLLLSGAGLVLAVFVLHKLGKALTAIVETLAAAAVVFVVIWSLVKLAGKSLVWLVKHWRTTVAAITAVAWCVVLGWPSLAITVGTITLGLLVWWRVDAVAFDRHAGRHLRSWWLRWTLYAPKLPKWLHNCGLSIKDDAIPVDVNVSLVGRRKVARSQQRRNITVPRVLGVRSGPSWDEVRVRLVPGQKPEDYDAAARPLASARKVNRCQVRELEPNVVSIDFQRQNLLEAAVPCADLSTMDTIAGTDVDLSTVYAGKTEYGRPWHVPLAGGHTLVAGATGAGKGSVLWCPLVSIAPAIRGGQVRLWGVDPKGMELAYGRRIFGDRYAVTGKDTVALLDELLAVMDARKTAFAGDVRTVPISTTHPLELLEFDEIAALTRYTDRKTREQITERVALLTTQGRALGITVRGYVQEPTKDTVPVRELFPRRICLRVTSKTHVAMVLGDGAYERGAWANRITETEAGTGYVFGEGIREPLRIRAGWVDDRTIKRLEQFITGRTDTAPTGTVINLPALEGRAAS